MTLHRVLVLGLTLALAGCGGGGGGGNGGGGSSAGGPAGGGAVGGGPSAPGTGDGGNTGSPNGGAGGDTGSPNGGTGGDTGSPDGGTGGDTGSPDDGNGGGEIPVPTGTRAKIVFPWTRSAATAPRVTVRGTAADPDGVASVIVNGAPAVLTPVAAAASKRSILTKGTEGEVEWSAEITLATGDNEVTVNVKDEGGEITEKLASSTIRYVEVPVYFNLDAERSRIVGLSYTLTPTGYVQHLVQHNYATGAQKIFDTVWANPASTCFRGVENQFLYLRVKEQNVRELRQYDLTAREDKALFQIPPSALDPGTDFLPGLYTEKLQCDSNHTSAYLLVNYTKQASNRLHKSRVIEIPLDGVGIHVLTETDTSAAQPFVVTDIALDTQALVAERDGNNGPEPLWSIPLLGGPPVNLTPGLGAWGLALAPALDLDRVYVATFEGVDEVKLSIPSKRNISEVAANHPLTFSQSRAIGFDRANSRILVGDDELDMVIGIDLATGERSSFIARNVGQGTPLISPRAFQLTADGLRAYVADDGGNAPARLFKIDLASGNRTEVGEISTAITGFVTGLALDEARGRVFVSGERVIIAVDLKTGAHEIVADFAATDLHRIGDLLLDAEGGHLLFADPIADGIYALDLVTRRLETVSDASRGTGPAFGAARSMTRVGTSNELYVAGQNSERVTRVDLATGNREVLAHNCAATAFPLDQVLYSEPRHELLINGDRRFSLDLASGQCTELPHRISTLQMRTTSDDQLLAVWFRAMLQIDRKTGEAVIISK